MQAITLMHYFESKTAANKIRKNGENVCCGINILGYMGQHKNF
jgi:hypothetical protein